ncbi:MAG: YicC family protein [Neomegalonema sp.]|nr:YicC family protein [Neomegalonema sp.]
MRSMTGFAAVDGEAAEGGWRWELRSVNGRGLEVRFRTPSGFDHAEAGLRAQVGAIFARGTLTAALSLNEKRGTPPLQINHEALETVIAAAKLAGARAEAAGLNVTPMSIAALIGARGVLEADAGESDAASGDDAARAALLQTVAAGFAEALSALAQVREQEGARLSVILNARLDEIGDLIARARAAAADRAAKAPQLLAERVRSVLGAGAEVDPGRLAQELALLAVKADVTEELDRLEAHLAAGRDLLAAPPPVGRKLDFLTQEFNREANTLCAKSQDQSLTEIGLALKVAIDQLREQSANVE